MAVSFSFVRDSILSANSSIHPQPHFLSTVFTSLGSDSSTVSSSDAQQHNSDLSDQYTFRSCSDHYATMMNGQQQQSASDCCGDHHHHHHHQQQQRDIGLSSLMCPETNIMIENDKSTNHNNNNNSLISSSSTSPFFIDPFSQTYKFDFLFGDTTTSSASSNSNNNNANNTNSNQRIFGDVDTLPSLSAAAGGASSGGGGGGSSSSSASSSSSSSSSGVVMMSDKHSSSTSGVGGGTCAMSPFGYISKLQDQMDITSLHLFGNPTSSSSDSVDELLRNHHIESSDTSTIYKLHPGGNGGTDIFSNLLFNGQQQCCDPSSFTDTSSLGRKQQQQQSSTAPISSRTNKQNSTVRNNKTTTIINSKNCLSPPYRHHIYYSGNNTSSSSSSSHRQQRHSSNSNGSRKSSSTSSSSQQHPTTQQHYHQSSNPTVVGGMGPPTTACTHVSSSPRTNCLTSSNKFCSTSLSKFTFPDENGKRKIKTEIMALAEQLPALPGLYFDKKQKGFRVRYQNVYVGWVALSRFASIEEAYTSAREIWENAKLHAEKFQTPHAAIIASFPLQKEAQASGKNRGGRPRTVTQLPPNPQDWISSAFASTASRSASWAKYVTFPTVTPAALEDSSVSPPNTAGGSSSGSSGSSSGMLNSISDSQHRRPATNMSNAEQGGESTGVTYHQSSTNTSPITRGGGSRSMGTFSNDVNLVSSPLDPSTTPLPVASGMIIHSIFGDNFPNGGYGTTPFTCKMDEDQHQTKSECITTNMIWKTNNSPDSNNTTPANNLTVRRSLSRGNLSSESTKAEQTISPEQHSTSQQSCSQEKNPWIINNKTSPSPFFSDALTSTTQLRDINTNYAMLMDSHSALAHNNGASGISAALSATCNPLSSSLWALAPASSISAISKSVPIDDTCDHEVTGLTNRKRKRSGRHSNAVHHLALNSTAFPSEPNAAENPFGSNNNCATRFDHGSVSSGLVTSLHEDRFGESSEYWCKRKICKI